MIRLVMIINLLRSPPFIQKTEAFSERSQAYLGRLPLKLAPSTYKVDLPVSLLVPLVCEIFVANRVVRVRKETQFSSSSASFS